MAAVDRVNSRIDCGAIKLFGTGIHPAWEILFGKPSPAYLTHGASYRSQILM